MTKESSAVLRFSESLWGNLEPLEKLCVGNKKSSESAIKFTMAKMEIFQTTGKKLQALHSSKIGKYERSMGWKSADLLKEVENSMGRIYGEMSDAVKVKVVDKLEDQKTLHVNRGKTILAEISRVKKEQREALAKSVKAQRGYYKSCEEYHVYLQELKDQGAIGEDEAIEIEVEDKFRDKLFSKELEMAECKDSYEMAVKTVRSIRLEGDRKISKLIDAMQVMESERLSGMKEILIDLVSIQLEGYKRILAELSEVLEFLTGSYNIIDDVNEFIHLNISSKNTEPLPEFEEWSPVLMDSRKPGLKFFGLSNMNLNSKSNEAASQSTEEHSEKEIIVTQDVGSWSGWFNHLFDCPESGKCSLSCGIDASIADSPEDLVQILDKENERRKFSAALSFHRNHNSGGVPNKRAYDCILLAMNKVLDTVHVQKEIAPSLVVKEMSLGSAWSPRSVKGGIVRAKSNMQAVSPRFLDNCGAVFGWSRDVLPVRDIMIVSQTMYFLPNSREGGTRDFLARGIRSHKIWSDPNLWAEIFEADFQGEKAASRAKEVHRWMADEEIMEMGRINNNVLFGQLANLAHSMILFGNSSQDAKAFVLRAVSELSFPELLREQIFSIIDTGFSQSADSLSKT